MRSLKCLVIILSIKSNHKEGIEILVTEMHVKALYKPYASSIYRKLHFFFYNYYFLFFDKLFKKIIIQND